MCLAGGVLAPSLAEASGRRDGKLSTEGLPRRNFVYETRCVKEHSAVIAMPPMTSKPKPLAARWKMRAPNAPAFALATCGGSARVTRKGTYQTHGRNFAEEESNFPPVVARPHSTPPIRGKSHAECRARIGDRYPARARARALQRGFQRAAPTSKPKKPRHIRPRANRSFGRCRGVLRAPLTCRAGRP